MSIEDFHNYFRLRMDKGGSSSYTSFLAEEIDYFLQSSIYKFAKTRYSGNNPKREGFEESQKRIDDLRTLVKTTTLTATSSSTNSNNNTTTYTFTLPSDYLFLVSDNVNVIYNNVDNTQTTKVVGTTPITYDRISQELDNPFSNYIDNYKDPKPLRLFQDNYINLICDYAGTIIQPEGGYLGTYTITYIKKPDVVSLYTKNMLNGNTGNINNPLTVGRYYKPRLTIANTIAHDGTNRPTGVAFAATTTSFVVNGSTTIYSTPYYGLFERCDCNLPEHTHEEILKLAVNMALEDTENVQRYQTNNVEISTME
jgi:hypothetical protein